MPHQIHLTDYLNNLKTINHLFFAENPLSLHTYFYYTGPSNKRSAYFTEVYEGVVGNRPPRETKRQQLESLQRQGVLVWDIFHQRRDHLDCPICNEIQPREPIDNEIQLRVPIDSDLRSSMIKPGCTLHAFQTSIANLNTSVIDLNLEVSEECRIYFLMPQLTSLPILNHHNADARQQILIGGIDFAARLRISNQLNIENNETVIFPRHTINVIGGSNTPRRELINHARKNQ